MNNPTIKTAYDLWKNLESLHHNSYELRIHGNTDDKGGGQIQIVDTQRNKIVEIINVG